MNALLRQWPLALGALVATTATSVAQEFRTGDGLLQLRAAFPEEVRVGEQFTYTIEVKNTSENVVLHDIQLEQRKAQGLSIEGTSQASQTQQTSSANQSQNLRKQSENQRKQLENQKQEQSESKEQKQTEDQKQKQSEDQKQKQSEDQKQKQSEDQKRKQAEKQSQERDQQSSQQKQNPNSMVIAMLKPGESRMINVKASADQQGELQSCLEVVSYKPALCLTARAVKPELEITKSAPEKASRCEVIELVYRVKNGGSGDLQSFQVVDDLGDGLQTIDGEQTLKFQVDGLKAGDTREFLARVMATRAGTFGSRAIAQDNDSELKSRSQNTQTEIVAADLNVQLDGPGRLYGNQLAQFKAQVTNSGNVVAEDIQVQVRWPQDAALADISDPQIRMQSAQQPNNRAAGVPTLADVQVDQSNSQSQNKGAQAKQTEVAMEDHSFTIERLEPGQSVAFNYALRPGQQEKIASEVIASFVCALDAAKDQAQDRSETVAMATASTTIVRLPALQLIVLDDEDPVPNSSQVTYSIRVWNEGDAVDKQIELSAELPEGLEFEDAQGPTKHEVDGSNITFQPIETLKAGAHVDFRITATSKGEGDVRFVAKLSSDSLDSEVVGEEPTRLYDGQTTD